MNSTITLKPKTNFMRILQKARYVLIYERRQVIVDGECGDPNYLDRRNTETGATPAIIDLDGIRWSALPKDAAEAERINAKLKEWEQTIASTSGDQWAATEGARL